MIEKCRKSVHTFLDSSMRFFFHPSDFSMMMKIVKNPLFVAGFETGLLALSYSGVTTRPQLGG